MLTSLAELIAVLLLAGLLARFSRRYVSHEMLIEQNGALQVYITIVAATYGILVALVFVGQVGNRNDVSATLNHEAANLLFLYRLGDSMPDPASKARMQAAVLNTTEAVVRKEWPMMQSRNVKQAILRSPELRQVWDSIMAMNFDDPKSKVLADEAMRLYRETTENRRLRLLHAEDQIPSMLWLVLAVGALFFVAHTYLIGVSTPWYHVILTSMSVGLVFLLLRLIYQYQRPYEGPFALDAEPYVLTLQRIRELLL